MKCHFRVYGIILKALLLFIPISSFAGWQVSKPGATIPREPFFQAGTQQKNLGPSVYASDAYPTQYANLGQPAAIYAVSISGSLKENLERIMERYHWRVVWKAPYDYNFDGRVTGASLPNVVAKLLKPFPLRAVMYMSNRTIAVLPRTPT